MMRSVRMDPRRFAPSTRMQGRVSSHPAAEPIAWSPLCISSSFSHRSKSRNPFARSVCSTPTGSLLDGSRPVLRARGMFVSAFILRRGGSVFNEEAA